MRSRIAVAKYTQEELKQMYLDVEKAEGKKKIRSKDFEKYGLPHVSYYNRAFKNLTNFYSALGRHVKPVKYRTKRDLKKFFYPAQWQAFLNGIENETHKFWFEFLLHTGMRINEARNVHVADINFERNCIFVNAAKGGRTKQRVIQISNYLKGVIQKYIKKNKISGSDNLEFPSTQYLDKAIKKYAEKAGIKKEEALEFSVHNIRKTSENWLLGIGIDSLVLTMWLGHRIDTAAAHYVSSVLFTPQEKVLIKSIMDNLLSKDGI